MLLHWRTKGKVDMTECRNNNEKAMVWERMTEAINVKFGTR
jgi:hypothetical protein